MADVPGRCVGVVLAAGQARRFGGQKLLEPVGGRPLVWWAAQALAGAGLWRLGAVVGPGGDVVGALPGGFKVLINPEPERGLGSSLAVGARWALAVGAGVMVVVLGDMAMIRAQWVAGVAREAWRVPAGAAAGMSRGRLVHPVAFARPHLGELSGLEGEVGGRGLLERLGEGVGRVEVEPWAGVDVDTPGDLALLRRLMGS